VELIAAATAVDGAARAILRPAATLDVTINRQGGRGSSRQMIAIRGSSAAGWEMDGSRVRWWPVAPAMLGAWLEEILPADESARDQASVELSLAEAAGLVAGRVPRELGPRLPDGLRALLVDPTAGWYSVRALAARSHAVGGISLRFLRGDQGGVWRFEESDGVVRASLTSAGLLRRELIDAWNR
jgi:hypothetical protein